MYAIRSYYAAEDEGAAAALLLLVLLFEQVLDCRHITGRGDDEDAVTGLDDVIAARHQGAAVAGDGGDDKAIDAADVAEFAQGQIAQRAAGFDAVAEKLHLPLDEFGNIEGAGVAGDLGNFIGDGVVGVDQQVDAELLLGKDRALAGVSYNFV